MTPAEEFLTARAELGMTQQQLAEALGYKRGRRTVGDIECGVRNPSEMAAKFLRALVTEKRP